MAVFADAAYWIALTDPRDPWRNQAIEARARLPVNERLVTTQEVLTEFLAHMSGKGQYHRQRAVDAVRAIYNDPDVEVIDQSRQTFFDGLRRYARRPDKEYSLQDCVSMNVMERMGIDDALTNDRHFEQEGFRALMR